MFKGKIMKIIKTLSLSLFVAMVAFTNPVLANDDDELDSGSYAVLLIGIGAVIYSANLESDRKEQSVTYLMKEILEPHQFQNGISLQLFPAVNSRIKNHDRYLNFFNSGTDNRISQIGIINVKYNFN